MKYTFSTPGGGPKIVLQSRPGESDRHIALKILAYLLFRDETGGLPLRIEQSVGQRHKPDLVATEPETGRVVLWIDCGQIEVKRLSRIAAANPHARVIVLKATRREAENYARAAARHLPPDGRGAAITCAGFAEDFVEAFRSSLRGTSDVSLERDGDDDSPELLCVTLNGETRETRLHQFLPSPPQSAR